MLLFIIHYFLIAKTAEGVERNGFRIIQFMCARSIHMVMSNLAQNAYDSLNNLLIRHTLLQLSCSMKTQGQEESKYEKYVQ